MLQTIRTAVILIAVVLTARLAFLGGIWAESALRSQFAVAIPTPTPISTLQSGNYMPRGASVQIFGNEYPDVESADTIVFIGSGSKEIMRLRGDGQIEFKVPQKKSAAAFVKSVKQLWPEICSCKGE